MITKLRDDVFIFDLWSPAYCRKLLARFEKLPREAPNTMNKYGRRVVGDELRRLLARVVEREVVPRLDDFTTKIGPLKKNPYGFVVDYSPRTQGSLAKHVDVGSAVTLNVCLGHEWSGGDLIFYDAAARKREVTVAHSVGQAILHRGDHVHRATAVTTGRRTNLILWCGARAA